MLKQTVKLSKAKPPTSWLKESIGQVFRSDTGDKWCISTPWQGWVTVTKETLEHHDLETDVFLRLNDIYFGRTNAEYYVELTYDEKGYEEFYASGVAFPEGFARSKHHTAFDMFVKIGLPYTSRGIDKKPPSPEDYKGCAEFGEF